MVPRHDCQSGWTRRIVASLLLVVLSPAVNAAGFTPEETRLVADVDGQKEAFATDLGQAVQIDSATENLAGVRQLG